MIHWLISIAIAALTSEASAHPLAPALLELREVSSERVDVLWKTSRTRVPGTNVQPRLPEECEILESPEASIEMTSVTTGWAARCPGGLVGKVVGVEGLTFARIDALVRIQLQDGRSIRRVLRSGDESFTVPERESRLVVARDYAWLGGGHILSGLDHLLFVFGLLLLVQGWRALVATITAFTVGHSVTLSLAVLGLVRFPSGPIEVVIALSVFLLAVELARTPRPSESLIRRRPWVMSGGFGLLHGLGFAGALSEAGLPDHEIPLALFSFNVGIELGQLLFVAVVLGLGFGARPLLRRAPRWVESVPVYIMGTLGAYWCFERTSQLF